MGNPIGLNVVERRSSGTPVLTPGDVGNVAVVVKSPLGPEDSVIPINSLEQFRTIFGGPDTAFQSYYEMKGLFENAAPFNVNVYCVRSVDSAGTASSLELGTSPDTLTFERAYLGDVSTGAAGDNLKVEVIEELSGAFTLKVYNDDDDGNEVLVETITGLTDSNVEGKINDRSKFVKATVVGSYTLSANAKASLTSGADPTYLTNITSTELSVFDNENVHLLFAPDYNSETDASNLESYAAGRGDLLALASAPLTDTPSTVAANFSTTLLQAKSFLAGYFNWVKVDDLLGGDGLFTPALGHVIGAYYIRKMRGNNGFPFTPPAGLQTNLRGIKEQNQVLTSAQIEQVAHDHGLNVIQFYRGYGFVVRTSRTMSTLDKHYSIHIRRSLNYLVNSFNSQLGIFEQRQNNEDTRRQLATTLTNFLFQEYQNGMFETVGGFDANVNVVCDETNNDQQTRNARELAADTALNFAEVAETVYINIRKSEGQVNVDVG